MWKTINFNTILAFQAVEFSRLAGSLRPDESEDVIVSACQKLTAIFNQRPEQKIVFATQHGLLPLMELLDVPKTRVCLLFYYFSWLIFKVNFQQRCQLGYVDGFVYFGLMQVICAVLQIINQIIRDNFDFQENACLVGLVSATNVLFFMFSSMRWTSIKILWFQRRGC